MTLKNKMSKYLFEIGMKTADTMKFALYGMLKPRYSEEYEADFAGKLAAEVANFLFDGGTVFWPTSEFARQNRTLFETRARALSKEDAVCQALTCAIYNFCYAKYVEEGKKIGFLIHHYLGYVRAIQSRQHDVTARLSDSGKIPPSVSLPWLHLSRLGLMRSIPWEPDSKVMFDAVASFAASVRKSASP